MIIAIALLFAFFIALEIYSNGKYFGLGANPIILLIYNSLRLGSLLTAMILTWFYSQFLFWVLLTILIILLVTSFMVGNEKRKIKKIVRIYKNMEESSTSVTIKSLLQSTAIKYYQSLGWNSDDIAIISKKLFDNTDNSPDSVSTLAAWLLIYEYPSVMNRFGERCKIASKFYQKLV